MAEREINTFDVGISTTSGAFGALGTYTGTQALQSGGTAVQQQAPPVRMSLAATTTVYLEGLVNLTGGTATCNGFIRSRRVC